MKLLKIITLTLLTYVSMANANDALNLNWGSSTAVITEKITKNGNIAVIKYEISLLKSKQGYIVRQSDLDIISPVAPSDKAAEKAKLIAAMRAPDLLINEKGSPLDFVDFEAYINYMREQLGDQKVSNMLQLPNAKELLFTAARKNWSLWVSNWLELKMEEGKVTKETLTTEIAGKSLPTALESEIYTNWDNSKNVKLRFTSTVGGKEAIKTLTNFTEVFTKAKNLSNSAANNPENSINNFNKISTVTAILDPKTLKPTSVISEETTEMKIDTQTRTQREIHEFSFDWK